MERHKAMKALAALLAFLPFAQIAAWASGGDWYDDLPPPSLSDTLDMLPAKSFGDIFLETAPKQNARTADFEKEIPRIADRLGTETPVKLLPAVDDLLAQARIHYEDHGNDWCNLLEDVRDVVAGSSQDAGAARDYIRWRLENRNLFGFTPPRQTFDSPAAEHLQKRASLAEGPLKAHWLFLCGAIRFRTGDRRQCRYWFERVLKEFPDHPRAEIALFLKARCALSDSREENDHKEMIAAARLRAEEVFDQYTKKYPHGRFVADALGWQGALAFDAGDYMKALGLYIAQAEAPGHPETQKSAAFMCEQALAHLALKDEALDLIARHPRVAMGFTYFVLSAPEADNYDGKWDKPADVKKWRQATLPRIAAAVAKQKGLYKSGDWRPRYLAMLALAASGAGNQEQALQLAALAPGEPSDDLLFASGIARQRAGKAREAAAAFREFLERFPRNPLANGVRLRLALALEDDRRAGEAVAVLTPLDKADALFASGFGRYTEPSVYPGNERDWSMTDSSVYSNITGIDSDQVAQTIDTILNFAPLPELIAGLSGGHFDEGEKSNLRAVIAERYLARENFAEAKKFMTDAQFGLIASGLEKLTAAADAASGDRKADLMLRLGDAWAAARSKLLNRPLDVPTPTGIIPDDLLRRRNGQTLAMKNPDAELEERDELRHASRWWMRAARAAPGTTLAAQARWKALDAMAKIAAASAYAGERAREANGDKVSRELYDQLRAECPNSVEAKRYAVYWNFSTPVAQISWGEDRDARALGYEYAGANSETNRDEQPSLRESILALKRDAASLPPGEMAAEIRRMPDRCESVEDAPYVNLVDDLNAFFSEPNVTAEMQRIYVGIRLDVMLRAHGSLWITDKPVPDAAVVASEIKEALKNPVMKPVADYLEFSLLGLVSGAGFKVDTGSVDKDGSRFTFVSRDYARIEKMAREFLEKHPRSRKREAALFVLARSVQSLSRPRFFTVGVPKPGYPEGDYDDVLWRCQPEPFNPARVFKALDDYDRAFPNGRYAADVRNLRGYTFFQMHDWGKALDETLAQRKDGGRPDIQPEAAVRLVNIFAQLAHTECRADVLAALRSRPEAFPLLEKYLAQAGPLRYLQSYLGDQLGLH